MGGDEGAALAASGELRDVGASRKAWLGNKRWTPLVGKGRNLRSRCKGEGGVAKAAWHRLTW